jgi:hypothetical protein
MSDILERLQYMFFRCGRESPDDAANRRIQTAKDAATEIEKLRAAVQDLAKHVWRGDWDKLKPETRELLGEKQ